MSRSNVRRIVGATQAQGYDVVAAVCTGEATQPAHADLRKRLVRRVFVLGPLRIGIAPTLVGSLASLAPRAAGGKAGASPRDAGLGQAWHLASPGQDVVMGGAVIWHVGVMAAAHDERAAFHAVKTHAVAALRVAVQLLPHDAHDGELAKARAEA